MWVCVCGVYSSQWGSAVGECRCSVCVVCIAHSAAVQSVNVDALSRLVVSAGVDHRVKFWNFHTRQLITELKLDAAIARTCLHRDRCHVATALSVCLSVTYEVRAGVVEDGKGGIKT